MDVEIHFGVYIRSFYSAVSLHLLYKLKYKSHCDYGDVLFKDVLNTFYFLRLYGYRHMVKDHSGVREETRCHHTGYCFRLAARVLLYASSH